MNFLEASVSNAAVDIAGAQICSTTTTANSVTLGLRPEHLTLNELGPLQGTVSVFEHLGSESFVHVTLADEQTLVAKLDGEHRFTPGERCNFSIRPEYCHVFDDNEQRIVER